MEMDVTSEYNMSRNSDDQGEDEVWERMEERLQTIKRTAHIFLHQGVHGVAKKLISVESLMHEPVCHSQD